MKIFQRKQEKVIGGLLCSPTKKNTVKVCQGSNFVPFCGNVFESSGVDMRSSQKILRPSYIYLLPVRAKHWSEFLEKCGEEEAK